MLAIKIGNTNIGFGLFEGDSLLHSWRAETRLEKTADEYLTLLDDFFAESDFARASVARVALVSVVPVLTGTFREMCRRYFGREPFIVSAGITSGINLHYQDPRALGADRLVALVAAKARYGAPALVVDFGTATTFNALDAQGNFVGGAIAPGLSIQADALHQFTAKLPRVEISAPVRALATNTRDALRAGIFYGYVGSIDYLVARLRAEMNAPTARVIATGGLAALVAPACPCIEIVDAELALVGLRLLYEMNTPLHLQ